MGKHKGEGNTKSGEQMEGHNLLGAPTFEQLENGRFRCVETGHEMPAHARDSYAESKHCRLGLIDFALARNRPPLNMFKQDPASRSKLICKLTGVTINKWEEHIWKHINGKRFLNMLEKKEAEKEMPNGTPEKKDEGKIKKKKKKNKAKKEENIDEIINNVRDSAGKSSESDDETEFWMPPVGERWDNDDGGDRWGSDPDSEPVNDNDDNGGDEGIESDKHEDNDLSNRTKRMTLEIGPSSFASRKKKRKTDDASS
ncbi:uncharacterized protein LOC127257802 [Andrographis paniculata]|uniref:uncharacterized protein LOC127257802 n=1 Tax=Andrographis paniculata TaxID=175694 RepID=UPI0021E6FCF9|nr:uncharacterized protein LOC127257802 [Andrographis paniculata]